MKELEDYKAALLALEQAETEYARLDEAATAAENARIVAGEVAEAAQRKLKETRAALDAALINAK